MKVIIIENHSVIDMLSHKLTCDYKNISKNQFSEPKNIIIENNLIFDKYEVSKKKIQNLPQKEKHRKKRNFHD
tara:strand:- start:174 stop:392 length:219 start_codon:yes stop_codon:yes gene_type:complete